MKSRVDTKWYSDGKKKSEHNYKVGFYSIYSIF